ncbi:sensor histidine kinase [Frateuria aurantia]
MQWRLIKTLGFVIALVWSISISMCVTYLVMGPNIGWRVGLQSMGNALARPLPATWFGHFGPAGATSNVAAKVMKPSPGNQTQPAEVGSMLTAMVLNTTELALVGILVWWAIVASLRPLRVTSANLSGRRAFDLTAISVDELPDELKPLVQGFNALLGRLDTAMQAERQFIADAAHELRTPLAALHLQAEVALAAATMPDKDKALGKLLEVSLRTHRLAEQLLDRARLDAGLHSRAREPLDLHVVCRMIMDDFLMQASQRGTQLILEGASCPVHCDPDEIGILIRNLLDNAIRHGRAAGVVHLRCGLLRRGDARHPMLEIEDDGPGVDVADRDAIFTRFHRGSSPSSTGSGIGLSLVAGIAANHDAGIEVGFGPNYQGFRLRVMFPALAASVRPIQGAIDDSTSFS